MNVTNQSSSKFNLNQGNTLSFLQNDVCLNHMWLHQRESLFASFNYYSQTNNERIGLIVLPTGAGKSFIATLIPYCLGSSSVLVIAPSLTIVEQLYNNFSGNPSIYESKNIIREQDRRNFVEIAILVKETKKIETLNGAHLVISNAQKFGENTNANIEKLPNNCFDLVIVDDAHHYPARTWTRIIQHFSQSKVLFLTATPVRGNDFILNNINQHIIYSKERNYFINNGILRHIFFDEVGNQNDNEDTAINLICGRVIHYLNLHNQNGVLHQAMILTRTKDEANKIASSMNNLENNICRAYHSDTHDFVKEHFKQGKIKILVVCGKLLEGFVQPSVSIVAIIRNVSIKSNVLFTKFVGRAIRRLQNDTVDTALIISHPIYNQRPNFNLYDNITEEDPEEDD
jgi:superfamily II DNA or RNA helicase